MAHPQSGDTVKVHYTGRLGDGSVFDSSTERGPLELTVGEGQVIPKFEQALTEMEPGSVKGLQIVVQDAQAAREELLQRGAPVSEVEVLAWGTFVYFSDPDGNTWALQELPKRS